MADNRMALEAFRALQREHLELYRLAQAPLQDEVVNKITDRVTENIQDAHSHNDERLQPVLRVVGDFISRY
ncbi:hypothetical protein EG329_006385, partial [Mollisiaceae sp. DMI_Dod_QoI]